MSVGAYSLYCMSFFELQPQYLCFGLDSSSEWTTCTPEDFCDGPESHQISYKVDYSTNLSLRNWVQEYDMYCAPKYQFGLFGSFYFAAVVISCVIFPALADRVGRRRVALFGIILQLLATVLLQFSASARFTYFLVFCLGFAMPPRVFVAYIYTMEFVPQA